jgi:hypothetical protein
MRLLGWARVFEERKTVEDIPNRVRNTEVGYWYWMILSIVVSFVGLGIMLSAPEGSLKLMLLGLFIAVDGAIAWAVIKIVTHVRLAMYWIIWDSHHRNEERRPA